MTNLWIECPSQPYRGWIARPSWFKDDIYWCYLAYFLEGVSVEVQELQPYIHNNTIMTKVSMRLKPGNGFPAPGLLWPWIHIIDYQGAILETDFQNASDPDPEYGWRQNETIDFVAWVPGTASQFDVQVDFRDAERRIWRPTLERNLRVPLTDFRTDPNYIDNAAVDIEFYPLEANLHLRFRKSGKTLVLNASRFTTATDVPVDFIPHRDTRLIIPSRYGPVTTPRLYRHYLQAFASEQEFIQRFPGEMAKLVEAVGSYGGQGFLRPPGQARVRSRSPRFTEHAVDTSAARGIDTRQTESKALATGTKMTKTGARIMTSDDVLSVLDKEVFWERGRYKVYLTKAGQLVGDHKSLLALKEHYMSSGTRVYKGWASHHIIEEKHLANIGIRDSFPPYRDLPCVLLPSVGHSNRLGSFLRQADSQVGISAIELYREYYVPAYRLLGSYSGSDPVPELLKVVKTMLPFEGKK